MSFPQKACSGEGLECPICRNFFNIVENIPYVFLCGHTLCKNYVLCMNWAIIKFPALPIRLPFLISCPWCNSLSLWLMYHGNLKFPCKNFFLLWMVESINCNGIKSGFCGDHLPLCSLRPNLVIGNQVSNINHIRATSNTAPQQLESNSRIGRHIIFDNNQCRHFSFVYAYYSFICPPITCYIVIKSGLADERFSLDIPLITVTLCRNPLDGDFNCYPLLDIHPRATELHVVHILARLYVIVGAEPDIIVFLIIEELYDKLNCSFVQNYQNV
ncbi:hypothetical protein RJ641_014613 [Dillenia turbinata]|uniref:RING-type domain-containing protein n=1 Tax=Dillenia turbinata TaxID=194707 RepID=A0AAN8US02_9MAGN